MAKEAEIEILKRLYNTAVTDIHNNPYRFEENIVRDMIARSLLEGIKALEKADKYQWHDLRKNPEDLPERYENVLLHTLKSGDVVAYLGKDEWYVDYDDECVFCDEGSCYAVAWRYIEPFEEESK